MARKEDPAPRLSDVRLDYEKAVESFVSAAVRLSDVTKTVLQIDDDMGKQIPAALRAQLEKAVADFEATR
jgi:hypothetical protein